MWQSLCDVFVSFRDVKPDNILLDEQGKDANCSLIGQKAFASGR